MNPIFSPEALAHIGGQHAALAANLDSFAAQIFDYGHREAVAEMLRGLLVDVGMHFGYEEALMIEGGYPEFAHHRRQHVALMTELGQLLDRVEEMADPTGVARSVDFLAHWYRQHLAHSDAALEAWLAERFGEPRSDG